MINEIKKSTISISSLNVKGIKGNLHYSRYLSQISNIVFLSETWSRPNDLYIFKSLANASKKQFIFKSDIDNSPLRGRPFGGLCWLYDSLFNLIEKRFINRYLSFIHLRAHNFEFVIIGIYMPFDDSNNRFESKSLFELNLSLVCSIIDEFKKEIFSLF